MKLINIPENPELDNFAARLFKYLQDHKFQGEIDYNDILEQADRAYNAMWDYGVSGHNINLSLDMANAILFENVGESEYEVIAEILRENFQDTVDLSSEEAIDFWTIGVLNEMDNLFEECERYKFGLSAADVDINRDLIISRIVIFFESYGL